MKKNIVIYWFRQDLRLCDNPALSAAAQYKDCAVLPIYIDENEDAHAYNSNYVMGAASQWWLHHSLTALQASLQGNLSLYHGKAMDVFKRLMQDFDVKAVFWNRCYEPWRIARDTKIKEYLKSCDIDVATYQASLLWEPWQIKNQSGGHYKVFTPFYRKGCLNAPAPTQPLPAPKNVHYMRDDDGCDIAEFDLLPNKNWGERLATYWQIGEDAAHQRFDDFIKYGLKNYRIGRDAPAKKYVSRLSPHLHFGEISPHQLWHSIRHLGNDDNIDHFCSELGWREFSYHQLYINPDLPTQNLQDKFDGFDWLDINDETKPLLKAWQRGNTGIPMVDAGMRELWQTGYMHNRVRMIVGSFLVKNLRIHWHYGERWFWDTLLDADLANNSASWQWVAGCGADAAPYFRIFNPVTQGEKFDPDGDYIRQYIPEIAQLPNKYLFKPWEADSNILKQANITLGSTYPKPIIDLKQSRIAALEAFHALKQQH